MLTDAVKSSMLQAPCSVRDMSAETFDEQQLAKFWAEAGHQRRFTREKLNCDQSFENCFAHAACAEPEEVEDSLIAATILPDADAVVPGEESSVEDSLISEQWDKDFRLDYVVDGKTSGDIPTSYTVHNLKNYEKVAIGTFVDPAIIPGFKYRVRRLPHGPYLFKGEALKLVSIGIGYGKRITFEGNSLNHNSNYFWSDSNPEGFGFELQVVAPGDKFTLRNKYKKAIASCVITELQSPQEELRSSTPCEKHVTLKLLCNVEWFENNQSNVHRLVGKAIVKYKRGSPIELKVVDVNVGPVTGGCLIPGIKSTRSATVDGKKIGDVPAVYTINGLLPYELPVIGTYVDPRISVGFHYRVRPAHSAKHLFYGKALLLQAIGRGYGKRLTFQGDSIIQNDNFFWSDSQPDGFAFCIQSIFPEMYFRVENGEGEILGYAEVFRNDIPEVEESSKVLPNGSIEKTILVDFTSHLKLENCADGKMVRISGRATVVKPRKSEKSKVVSIETLGMDCQINTTFVRQGAKLTLIPEKSLIKPEYIFLE